MNTNKHALSAPKMAGEGAQRNVLPRLHCRLVVKVAACVPPTDLCHSIGVIDKRHLCGFATADTLLRLFQRFQFQNLKTFRDEATIDVVDNFPVHRIQARKRPFLVIATGTKRTTTRVFGFQHKAPQTIIICKKHITTEEGVDISLCT